MEMIPRDKRRESRNSVGRFRGGKLAPVMGVPVLPGEAGIITQNVMLELDPVEGRLMTQVTADITMVFVPTQACDLIMNPAVDYAGATEVVREKMLSTTPLFGLEAEGELTRRMGIKPIPIGGVKKTNAIARIAHNAAVNYLRKLRYTYAVQLLHTNTAMTPAILSQTVLDRLNGVLDPDERINGAVNLDLPTMQLPVKNLRVQVGGSSNSKKLEDTGLPSGADEAAGHDVRLKRVSGTDAAPVFAPVYADFAGAAAGGVSLVDFYNAEKQDRLIRDFRTVIDQNPVDGEEQVLRWVHGIMMEPGRHPWVIHQSEHILGQDFRQASDGTAMINDVSVSKLMLQKSVSVVVPKTELGGFIVTFVTVRPDETLADMPHPILSDVWKLRNRSADSMKLDPVPVLMRQVDANVAAGLETTVAFYTGYQELLRTYVDYGFSRELDQQTVENKNAIWQLRIPASVTPENVIYPETLAHAPFQNTAAEVVRYSVTVNAALDTPLFFGPTPIEDVDIVTTEDLFEGA